MIIPILNWYNKYNGKQDPILCKITIKAVADEKIKYELAFQYLIPTRHVLALNRQRAFPREPFNILSFNCVSFPGHK